MEARATFTLDAFDAADPYRNTEGVAHARAEIRKTFTGDVQGTSEVQMLSARCPDAGAGYVALEHLDVTVAGRSGTFALLHIGTMTATDKWAQWPICPGSGTGDLTGITGEGHIDIAEDGTHHFTLKYELGE